MEDFQVEIRQDRVNVITVLPDTYTCFNRSNERTFEAYTMSLSSRPIPDQSSGGKRRTGLLLDINALGDPNSNLHRLYSFLPEHYISNLLSYLEEYGLYGYEEKEGYLDCFSFVSIIRGGRKVFRKEVSFRLKNLEFLERDLMAGETVFIGQSDISNEDITWRHAAMYLGNGLYISKFGPNGRIIITNLSQMMCGFDCDVIRRVRIEVSDKPLIQRLLQKLLPSLLQQRLTRSRS